MSPPPSPSFIDERPVIDLAPGAAWDEAGSTEHVVQLYESDAFLTGCVSSFFCSGLSVGESALAIATPEHRKQIEEDLTAKGMDVAGLKRSRRLMLMDAAELLGLFMVDGMPDAAKFRASVGEVVGRATRQHRPLRAFGEMVALLWAEGNRAAAIRLEELWNELRSTHAFSLFCAYPLRDCSGADDAGAFAHVCRAHTRVIPSESYVAERSHDRRLRCITMLQQKASSLDREVEGRRRTELLQRAQQAKLELAIEATALGIWEFNPTTGIFGGCERCRAHFGLIAADDVSFGHWLRHVHPADRAAVEAAFRRGIDCSEPMRIEFRVSVPGGGVRWIASSARAFEGEGMRIIGTTMEVTERRSATEALERLVEERTARLSEMIGQLEAFASAVSHDLRTPLRAMKNYAEILRQECAAGLGVHGCHYVERITASAERMDRLIADILSFSRTTPGELTLEVVDLDRLAHALLDAYPGARLAPPAQIRIQGLLPAVWGNAAALTQCLSNLIDNALKFVAPGVVPEVRIWAELGPQRGGETICIFVQDNGIGIPLEAQQSVFALFHRAHQEYEGNGIGLATVQKAVARMGGRVGVTSKPGLGSTFWLEFRRAEPGAV
jgi:signal transduction histidine kinase